eukprot:gene3804-13874_t
MTDFTSDGSMKTEANILSWDRHRRALHEEAVQLGVAQGMGRESGCEGCTFCSMISIFGACFMFFLGCVIKANYPYVGEWYEPEAGRGSPNELQIATAAKNCFIVMGIYLGFAVFSILCLFYFKSKAKRS